MRIVSDPPMMGFIKRHKTAIMVTALVTSVALVVILKVALNDHDEFLEGKGLLDEYYELQD